MKTLFKNGFVIDGTGSAPFQGDVLIEDNTILGLTGTLKSRQSMHSENADTILP